MDELKLDRFLVSFQTNSMHFRWDYQLYSPYKPVFDILPGTQLAHDNKLLISLQPEKYSLEKTKTYFYGFCQKWSRRYQTWQSTSSSAQIFSHYSSSKYVQIFYFFSWECHSTWAKILISAHLLRAWELLTSLGDSPYIFHHLSNKGR